MDCSARRRKSSFSGEDELRKMSRVWMQDPQGMNLQEQQMIHRLQQQQQHMNEISAQQVVNQGQGGVPLSLQQRAMAAIALQEIRSSIDSAKHNSNNLIVNHQQQQQQQHQHQQQHQQQQQNQVAQAQAAQVQAQLFQKYQHMVQHQLKPPTLVDNRFSIPMTVQQQHQQLPMVLQQSPPPPILPLPTLVDVDPSKMLPASPQLINIPPVIFPPTLTSSPTVTTSMRPSPPPVPVAPSKLSKGDHFQSTLPLCPNISAQDLQPGVVKTSTWFTTPSSASLGAAAAAASSGGMFSGGTVQCSEEQQQQQQHLSSPSCDVGLDHLQGYSSSLCATSGIMSPLIKAAPPSGSTCGVTNVNLMPPPPSTAYNQPSNNTIPIHNNLSLSNNNNNNKCRSPILDQVIIPDFENSGEKAQSSPTPVMQSQQQQQQQQQRSAPTRTFTKVYKLGSIGRAVDVARFKNYVELRAELSRMFGLDGQLDQRNGWQLVFVDKENDLLLVGDDPWEEFVNSVRGIRILSPKEVSYYTSDERGAESA